MEETKKAFNFYNFTGRREDVLLGDNKSRNFPVDPNLPRWICQNCRNPLCVVGVDPYAEKFLSDSSTRSVMQGSSLHGANSMLGSAPMDNSFVVLPKQRPQQAHGVPPRPRGGGAVQPDSGHSGKAMDESFVVVDKSENASDGGGAHFPSLEGTNGQLQPNNSGFHSTISVLKRAFEIATEQTQVEQPLCLECMRVLSEKLDKEVEDVNRDIEAYEACLQQLEGEAQDVLSEADFLKEKLKIEEEERKLEAAIEETERQNAEVNAELKELEQKSNRFKELEERCLQLSFQYSFKICVCARQLLPFSESPFGVPDSTHLFAGQCIHEERDAILAKAEVSQAHLELLMKTNVLNDAFPIHHDGEFGTINNFRLGRLPKIPVEWDEINAAWGQACLLLHTMCQYFKPKFQYPFRIMIMIFGHRLACFHTSENLDSNDSKYPVPYFVDLEYSLHGDVFGPVNLFWSTRYDKAMALFLTCLKDFADFAYSKDVENNVPPERRFRLPYKIENDKVENHPITQSFNKAENWTKALKYTLCDLKWALYWFIGSTNFQPLSAMAAPRIEVPSVNASNRKRGTDSKSVSRHT
ncbi:hypothetical protein Tsubulata_013004 [Turnera subulata]|uniref:Beclin-1-like protein n=1 Tax=Turnera subulata TaxID=218843 RepID=A0A9Q0FCJ7_9ROSI|nr:hypothetical protein Tsubulata_013004 [Turnera subulata]